MVLSEGKDIPGEAVLVHGAGDCNRHTGKIENLKIITTDYTDCHRLKNYVFYPPVVGQFVSMWFIIYPEMQTAAGVVVISRAKDKTLNWMEVGVPDD